MFWQIAGSYEYGLVKEDGQWTIDKMTFIAESEQGDKPALKDTPYLLLSKSCCIRNCSL